MLSAPGEETVLREARPTDLAGKGPASLMDTATNPGGIHKHASTDWPAQGPGKRGTANRFFLTILRELLGNRRLLAGLAASIGAYAISHGATALAAGLLGRALSRAGGNALIGPWGWSLATVCYLGLAATLVKAVSSTFLAFSESLAGGIVGCVARRQATRCLLERGAHDSAPRVLATIAVRIREVESASVSGVLVGIRAAAQLVPLALALIFVSAPLALLGIVALAPFAVGISLLRRRWRAASAQAQGLVEELHSGVDDLVKNLDLWRSYGAGHAIEQQVESSGELAARAAARVDAGRAALSGSNEVLGALALLGGIAIAARLGFPLGDGRLIAFAAVFFMAYRPLRDLGDARAWTLRGAVALERLEDLLGAELLPGRSAPDQRQRAEPAGAPHALCRLTLSGAGARTHGPTTSLRLEPGEMVSLMGPTGSGKTTLLRTLLGLEPARGSVAYAERDITGAAVGPGARPFAWVPQDAPLVTGSLLDNVALCGGDEQTARAALEQIGADALLASLGSTTLGPGGRALSGGERRLVSIARALASGQPVLLLDEPTEGLDAEAQQRVLDVLSRLKGQRSAIVVTHRPEVAAVADRVVAIAET